MKKDSLKVYAVIIAILLLIGVCVNIRRDTYILHGVAGYEEELMAHTKNMAAEAEQDQDMLYSTEAVETSESMFSESHSITDRSRPDYLSRHEVYSEDYNRIAAQGPEIISAAEALGVHDLCIESPKAWNRCIGTVVFTAARIADGSYTEVCAYFDNFEFTGIKELEDWGDNMLTVVPGDDISAYGFILTNLNNDILELTATGVCKLSSMAVEAFGFSEDFGDITYVGESSHGVVYEDGVWVYKLRLEGIREHELSVVEHDSYLEVYADQDIDDTVRFDKAELNSPEKEDL